MPHSLHTYTGTNYNVTVALLVVAFVFSPASLALFHPVGFTPTVLAIGTSTLCVFFAWVSWKRSSNLTIASVVR